MIRSRIKTVISFLTDPNLPKSDAQLFEGSIEDLMAEYPNARVVKIEYVDKNVLWKYIVGSRKCYKISNKGEILSVARRSRGGRMIKDKLLTPFKNTAGNLSVTLYIGGRPRQRSIRGLMKEHWNEWNKTT
jgi:hypothetical protein